jgi:WD40 repeat protein
MTNYKEEFINKKYAVVTNAVDRPLIDFITQYALFDEMQDFSPEGFGTQVPLAHSKYADPAILPTGSAHSADIRPQQDDIAVGHANLPRITAYPWSYSGFGTKYANPGVGVGSTVRQAVWSPSGNDIFAATDSTSFIHAYPWTTGSGFGSRYANPGTLPPAGCNGVAVSYAGNYVSVAHTTSPYITTYPWTSGTGFGTRVASPVSGNRATDSGLSVAFNPADDTLVLGYLTGDYILAYPWTGVYGTKYAAPATLPGGAVRQVKFSPDGNDIASGGAGPGQAYPWSSGFGTKYANPASPPAGNAWGASFSRTGNGPLKLAIVIEPSFSITKFTNTLPCCPASIAASGYWKFFLMC